MEEEDSCYHALLPSAPPPASSFAPALAYPTPQQIQSLMVDFQELKDHLSAPQYVILNRFQHALQTRDWPRAASLLSHIWKLDQGMLDQIFQVKGVEFFREDLPAGQIQFFRQVLQHTKLKGKHLARIKILNSNALIMLLLTGDPEILAWISRNTTDKTLKRALICHGSTSSLVQYAAYYHRHDHLQILCNLRWPQRPNLEVFPVNRDSDWTWDQFSKSVRRIGDPESLRDCLVWWAENIGSKLLW